MPYFDYAFFDREDEVNLLLASIMKIKRHRSLYDTMFEDIDIIEKIGMIIDFLNTYCKYLEKDISHIAHFVNDNYTNICQTKKYEQLFMHLIDYYIDNKSKQNESHTRHYISNMIFRLFKDDLPFYINDKLYNILGSKHPYFSEEIDDKIRNMYMEQHKKMILKEYI